MRGSSEESPHLEFVLKEAADAVAALRAEGETVLLHCVQAQSRTPTVAALYSMRHLGVDRERAVREVCVALPHAHPNRTFAAVLADEGVPTGGLTWEPSAPTRCGLRGALTPSRGDSPSSRTSSRRTLATTWNHNHRETGSPRSLSCGGSNGSNAG